MAEKKTAIANYPTQNTSQNGSDIQSSHIEGCIAICPTSRLRSPKSNQSRARLNGRSTKAIHNIEKNGTATEFDLEGRQIALRDKTQCSTETAPYEHSHTWTDATSLNQN